MSDASSHYRDGRRYAERVVRCLRSWSTAKPKPRIAIAMYVGIDAPLTVFKLTLGEPSAFVRHADAGHVARFVARAKTIAPTCDPAAGDLGVFDGFNILLFRRFDERLTLRAAEKDAEELAVYVLMGGGTRKKRSAALALSERKD